MHESTEEQLGKLTAEQRAALVAEVRARRAAQRKTDRLCTAGRDKPLPLSFAQQRLWLMHQWADGKPVYNTSLAMRVRGELHANSLRDAVTALVARHESLRTHYINTPDGPRQIIGPPGSDLFSVFDLRRFENREHRAAEVLAAAGRRWFDLERDPLLRATLVRLADDDHLFVLVFHHIATDAWSTEILTRELLELYEAARTSRPAVLPDLPIQYADYAAWQHTAEAAAQREASTDYWRRALADLEVLRFPTDRPRPANPSWAGSTVQRVLPPQLHRELQALGGAESTRVLPLALAALAAVSTRYTGQSDIVVGTTFSGRTRSELEQLIGYFANTVVLRVSTAGDPNFRELLARAKDTVYSAHPHQDVPFDQLVTELRPDRDASANPLFQVALLQVNEQLKPVRMGDVEVEGVPLHNGTSRFDLTLNVAERSAGGVELSVEFATELFDRDRMDRFLRHTHRILESAVSHPDARLSELDLLPWPERVNVTVGWNDTATPVAPGTVHADFDAQVERTPDATAVVSGDATLYYAELRRRANQIAHRLLAVGAGPGSLVGIAVGRSVDMVAALLGVLKAGAAYVQLDLRYPATHLGFVLEDAVPAAVIVDSDGRAAMTEHGVTLVDVADVSSEPVTPPPVMVKPEMLAYVCYSSGSTGQPKGVMVDHRNLMNLYVELDQRVGTDEPGVWLAAGGISFDISVVELLWTLARGFTVVVAEANTGEQHDASLASLIRTHDVSHMQCTPTLAGLLAGDPEVAGALGSLKVLFVGGEALTADLVRRLHEITPAELHNVYGPTETTVWSTAERIVDDVTIGTPLANETAYVLDRGLRPQPVGVAGELFIGGGGVAAGYHRRPGLTAARFVPDPFVGGGNRLYRTGDLARWRGDGRLEILGRVDDKVKICGHLLEPGEVESALRTHPEVRSAAVAARGETGQQYLAAYLVPRNDTRPEGGQLRRHLRELLPEHMVPARFVWLDAFPLTRNGKVDRKLLPDPGVIVRDVRYEPPATTTEQILAEVWHEVLGGEPVGVLSNLFDLGGNSLSVVLAVDKANRRGVPVTARQLFQHQTIRELAEVAVSDGAGAGPIVPLNESGTLAPLICLHASSGSSLPYVPLSKHLGDRPCYAIELPKDAPADVPELGRRYAAAIRLRWPEGPYHLVGWSIGGSLAMAVAAELGDVGLLALLDTAEPAEPAVAVPLPVAMDGFVRGVAAASDTETALDISELSALDPDAQYEKALDRLDEAGLLPAGQRDQMLARAHTFVDLTTAVSVWRPTRHAGVVDLLLPRESAIRATVDWESYVDGGVRTTIVLGDHFSMMRPAVARDLAAVLRRLAALRETDRWETEMEVGHE